MTNEAKNEKPEYEKYHIPHFLLEGVTFSLGMATELRSHNKKFSRWDITFDENNRKLLMKAILMNLKIQEPAKQSGLHAKLQKIYKLLSSGEYSKLALADFTDMKQKMEKKQLNLSAPCQIKKVFGSGFWSKRGYWVIFNVTQVKSVTKTAQNEE